MRRKRKSCGAFGNTFGARSSDYGVEWDRGMTHPWNGPTFAPTPAQTRQRVFERHVWHFEDVPSRWAQETAKAHRSESLISRAVDLHFWGSDFATISTGGLLRIFGKVEVSGQKGGGQRFLES